MQGILAGRSTDKKQTAYECHVVIGVPTLVAEREIDKKRHVKTQLRNGSAIRIAMESKYAASLQPELTSPGEGITESGAGAFL